MYLHSQQCFDNSNRCSDLYASYALTNFEGVAFHAPLNDFFSECIIKWNALDGEALTNIKQEHT